MLLVKGNDMSTVKITECRCCGNRDSSRFAEKENGYVCKCCGVWFRYETEEEKLNCAIGYRYLRTYNFEAARTVFEETLDKFPQSVDARWGLLLARFGVVFIKGFYDDVIEPVYCFPDYDELEGRFFQSEEEFREIRSIIGNDTAMRRFYDEKAREIDRAIKKFRECKSSIERDVFICVKISASTEKEARPMNERTRDYEFALKAYNDLKKRGLNVFFSFVTLKNEVNSDDLIWLNLVKSKKMLLIGSREEYLESAWVKSEWQRWRFLGRSDDMYICILNDVNDSPKKILPYELRKDSPQIYTPETYKKMLSDICGYEEPEEEAPRQTTPERAEKPHEPQKTTEIRKPADTRKPEIAVKPDTARKIKYDGQIVYSNGNIKILEYGCEKIISDDDSRKNIVSIVLPNSVTAINKNEFSSCSSLRSILIPDSVISIGERAFEHCTGIISIDIPYGVKEIGRFAFANCTALKTVSVPDSVTHIGVGAFYNCNIMKSVSLSKSITSIAENTFQLCYSLKGITIPKNVTSIGEKAFCGCDELATVSLPESITSIGNSAFFGCRALKRLELSQNVSHIGINPFRGCRLKLKISPKNPNFMVMYNSLFSADGKKMLAYIPPKEQAVYVIPDCVTDICESAFDGARLKSLTIPAGVAYIAFGAFDSCFSSENVYFNGTKAEWEQIDIRGNNSQLQTANIHFRTLYGYTK